MSLLAILELTLVMKCFWLRCLGLCCLECCNYVISSLNGKSIVLCITVVISSELGAFLGDSFVTTVFG
jgi:hypothetical protein